jgi:hypothetical protein
MSSMATALLLTVVGVFGVEAPEPNREVFDLVDALIRGELDNDATTQETFMQQVLTSSGGVVGARQQLILFVLDRREQDDELNDDDGMTWIGLFASFSGTAEQSIESTLPWLGDPVLGGLCLETLKNVYAYQSPLAAPFEPFRRVMQAHDVDVCQSNALADIMFQIHPIEALRAYGDWCEAADQARSHIQDDLHYLYGAFAHRRDAPPVVTLRRYAESPEWWMRLFAAEFLRHCKLDPVPDYLKTLENDNNPYVAESARVAIMARDYGYTYSKEVMPAYVEREAAKSEDAQENDGE